ncbi:MULTISPECIES: DUF1761 domain-containing protein [Kordiimonas]|jgi:predicted permease|uniref:DUF1761 domain-containing protein n=1 Tax=Kordiimonas TaxID=288021 RepID=UPI00257D9A59|nr:DUF1761 domain-containing protein [Kordiimonas sp. UBA4487]
MELLANMNWLAVLLGAVIYMAVGSIWYGPIAGKAWMAEMGLTEEEIKASGSPAKAMAQSFVAALFLSAGLEFILSMQSFADGGWMGGVQVGFVLSVLIIGGGTFANYAFENKTLRHFLIHMGNITLAMMAMGAMMGAWN